MNTLTPVAACPVQVDSDEEGVVLKLDVAHAEQLGRILAHYDSLPKPDLVDGYDPEVWHRTLIRLIVEAAHFGIHPEPVHLPHLRAHGTGSYDDPIDLRPVYFTPDQWARVSAADRDIPGGRL